MSKPSQRRTLTARAQTRRAATPQTTRRPAWGAHEGTMAAPKPLPMALAVASALGLSQSVLAADNTITLMQRGGSNVTGTHQHHHHHHHITPNAVLV